MNKFSASSQARLATCHTDLQRLMIAVLPVIDMTIVSGHRNAEQQAKAVADGHSKTTWPNSEHNATPSFAVDVAPWSKENGRIPWEDTGSFLRLMGAIQMKAFDLGIKVKFGVDFKTGQQGDYGHVELDVE